MLKSDRQKDGTDDNNPGRRYSASDKKDSQARLKKVEAKTKRKEPELLDEEIKALGSTIGEKKESKVKRLFKKHTKSFKGKKASEKQQEEKPKARPEKLFKRSSKDKSSEKTSEEQQEEKPKAGLEKLFKSSRKDKSSEKTSEKRQEEKPKVKTKERNLCLLVMWEERKKRKATKAWEEHVDSIFVPLPRPSKAVIEEVEELSELDSRIEEYSSGEQDCNCCFGCLMKSMRDRKKVKKIRVFMQKQMFKEIRIKRWEEALKKREQTLQEQQQKLAGIIAREEMVTEREKKAEERWSKPEKPLREAEERLKEAEERWKKAEELLEKERTMLPLMVVRKHLVVEELKKTVPQQPDILAESGILDKVYAIFR